MNAPRSRRAAIVVLVLAAVLVGCSSDDTPERATDASGASTSTSRPAASPAVSGGECPFVVDESKADFYPIQPSFSAGYTMAVQTLDDDTDDWAYVVEGDFPYSYWMAWYLYTEDGKPIYKFSDTKIEPDDGSTNPFVAGNLVLAPDRSYTIYFMPNDTPADVVSDMQGDGKNVALLPDPASNAGVSLVSRSYWSLANDDLGDYDRFGYGGPTETPFHTITAFETDATSGEVTDTQVSDCGSASKLPQRIWYDADTGKPVITFENASPPADDDLTDLPKWLVQTGSASGTLGKEFPPSPVANEVQFYRNVAASAPYADVQSAPAAGNPPDACGGYVMANLPNDVVSLVRIPQVPTFPDYRGATAETLNDSDQFQVQFYSVVIYGAQKQLDAVGTVDNSQIGNRQILQDADGGATVVLYPRSATDDQVAQIAAVAEANGWNLLKSGEQTTLAPNLLTIREKGQNATWPNALSANQVTQGAPCPQSTDATLPLPQDPPDAQVTQSNGMGLTAPSGENCTVEAFLSGECLEAFQSRLRANGQEWSAAGAWPSQITP